jgi:hypothetical protein
MVTDTGHIHLARMKIEIDKFDITSISCDKSIVLVGKRDTGKSFLVRDLLYYQRNTPMGVVISPTESANNQYTPIIPHMFIHEEYHPDTVGRFVERQKVVTRKIRKQKKLYGSSNIDPRAFLILDDCLYDSKAWSRDKNIRLMFLNGRHYKTLFLITMQYPLGVPPDLRSNIDYAFILRENNIGNRKRLYDNFAGMIPTFDLFCVIMDQCTENYECLVINVNAKSNRLTDQLFWYKAEPHPEYKMCDPNYWAMCDDENGSDDSCEEEMLDLTSIRKNKNMPRINVVKKTA